MKVIQLDVTSKKQIEDALGYITEQLNGKGIDRTQDILASYEYYLRYRFQYNMIKNLCLTT